MLRDWFKKYWGLFLVILLSFWTIKPLFHEGFFPMHDDTQVVRVSQMAKALREGQFPVRWVSDLGYGYGYPLFNFYAPLPYYVGAVFNLIGFDVLVSTKIMFDIGILLAGIFMYFLAREFFGEAGGVLSAVLYQYAPYHAADIYVRGAVGEFWAMAFLPLVVYGIYKILKNEKVKTKKEKRQLKIKNYIWQRIIAGGVGYAGLILSHNITAMLFTFILIPSLILFIILQGMRNKRSSKFFSGLWLSLILGLGLSAFFWLPALVEAKYTNVEHMIKEESNFQEHFLYLDQLWDSPWGFAGSGPGRADGMSFKIGKLHIILAMVGVLFLVYSWRKGKLSKMATWLHGYMATLLILSVFMTTEHSKFVWEAIPLLTYAQYPWRFLVFIIFTTSFLAGGIAMLFKSELTRLHSCIILSKAGVLLATGLVIFVNAKYFQPQEFLAVSAIDYINQENIKWTTSKISDEYLPKNFSKPKTAKETVKEKIVLEKEVEILSQETKSHRYKFTVNSQQIHNVLIRTAYFPGWEVLTDDKKSDFTTSNRQILIPLSSGRHEIVVKFSNTAVRILANLISLLSLAFLTVKAIQVKNINQNRFVTDFRSEVKYECIS